MRLAITTGPAEKRRRAQSSGGRGGRAPAVIRQARPAHVWSGRQEPAGGERQTDLPERWRAGFRGRVRGTRGSRRRRRQQQQRWTQRSRTGRGRHGALCCPALASPSENAWLAPYISGAGPPAQSRETRARCREEGESSSAQTHRDTRSLASPCSGASAFPANVSLAGIRVMSRSNSSSPRTGPAHVTAARGPA